MPDELCEMTELLRGQCAHCRPAVDEGFLRGLDTVIRVSDGTGPEDDD